MKNTGERYDWKGMIIITVLIIIGILILYFTWGGMEINYENVYNYIFKKGIIVIFSLFFIGVGIYCWIMFFCNVIIKPKKETLYLKSIENNIYSFIDSKGKKYMFTSTDTKKFDIDKYYLVMKTKDIIKEVLEISSINFPICKEKRNFWLNWYSPMGNFENIFLLPILYVMFLPGLLSFIMSEGFNKIYGLIFMFIPGVFIVYDINHKIKMNKDIEKNESDQKVETKSIELNEISSDRELSNKQENKLADLYIIKSIPNIIAGLIISCIFCWVFIKAADNMTRIISVPFLICGLTLLISGIATIICASNEIKTSSTEKNSYGYKEKQIKNHNFLYFLSNLFYIVFLIFWFIFLIIWCYTNIKDKAYAMAFFSIPFWIAGIAVVHKKFLKK